MRTGTWSAPGRVNLIGEHTDYADGFVLPIPIGLRTSVTATTRADHEVHVRSRQDGAADSYVAGAVQALREHGVDVPGLDIVVDSRLPIGAGLSSSAALTCACVLAAAEHAGAQLSPVEIARLAQRAESEFVGVPCGLMDQLAAMTARAGHALFLDMRTLEVEHVPFDPDAHGLALLVVDTGVRHRLADGAYAERRRQVEEAARQLGVPALRDITVDDLGPARTRLDDVLWRRSRHVVSENQRVIDVVTLMRAGRLAEIGPLLSASHQSLRDMFEVSAPALDTVVSAAMAAGAAGARMTGGGFGGSAIALVPVGYASAVTEAVTAAAATAGHPVPVVMTVTAGEAARRDR